jgi:histidine triad (HIT) family protein
MKDCLFCKIVAGDVPATKVYEDDNFLAFQDLKQASKGHMLIIPKEHSADLLEMNPALGNELLRVIQQVSNAMLKGLGAQGINVIFNCKPAANQEIFHTHAHLVPRYEGDGLKGWPQKETTEEERVMYAEKIILALD